MYTIVTTKAISSAASAAVSGIIKLATTCKTAAVIAGHQITSTTTLHVVPAIKLAWLKFATISAPACRFITSPIGLCSIGIAAGAIVTTIGVGYIVTSRGAQLAGHDNNTTRRVVLSAGIAMTTLGLAFAAAGLTGLGVILL